MRSFQVQLPDDNADRLPNSEYVLVTLDSLTRPVRLHDYATLYAVPGLYEYVISDLLACRSPDVLADLLVEAVQAVGDDVMELSVLDLGAGNGLGGAALAQRGVRQLVGIDIVPEAAQAAARDHPGLYQDYFIVDLAAPEDAAYAALAQSKPTCLLCLSAIGLHHVPPAAFCAAYRLLPLGGWVAFNLKEDFLHADSEGFARLIQQALAAGALEEHRRQRYVHRRHVDGRDLINVALVGRKRSELTLAAEP